MFVKLPGSLVVLQYFDVCKVTLLLYYTVVYMWGYGTVGYLLFTTHILKKDHSNNSIFLFKKHTLEYSGVFILFVSRFFFKRPWY